MSNPPAPSPPSLHPNEDAGREIYALTIVWASVQGAQAYRVKVDGENSTWTLDNVASPLKVHQLASGRNLLPMTRYELALSYKVNNQWSDYSAKLTTATRPPAPTAPTIQDLSLSNLIQVTWNITSLSGVTLVRLGRFEGDPTKLVSVKQLTALHGSFPDNDLLLAGSARSYALAVGVEDTSIAGGENWSWWGAQTSIHKVTFGRFHHPGSPICSSKSWSLIKQVNQNRLR